MLRRFSAGRLCRAASCSLPAHRLLVIPQSSGRCGARALSTALQQELGPAVRHEIRNVAIVAHVDHGKTTLVDALLQATKEVSTSIGKDDRLMDSNDQERERGITILAKNAAVTYKDTKINIVDTPGHADFGGEVERVLNMVDGVLLVVDAADGPKPQTRFVLKKAIAMGHKVLVVLNKIDKPQARPGYVVDKTFDLFCELGASDEQTDFNIVYTSAINRQSGLEVDDVSDTMAPLLDSILELPKPVASVDDPLQLQLSNIGHDAYIGRLGIGRIKSGVLHKNRPIGLCAGPNRPVMPVKCSDVFVYSALGRSAVETASAGDIVMVAGISEFNIGDTLVDPASPMPLEPIDVEQPTMSITMGVNKSAFAGRCKSSKHLTSRVIRERLNKELEVNVALQVKEQGSEGEAIQVFGRGLLHLTVLIENMRREGFEMMVGPPMVLYKDVDGEQHEPFETVDLTLPEEFAGVAIDLLSMRKGTMLDMGTPSAEGMQTLQFEVPSRGMFSVKSKMLNATRGLAVMTNTFAGYKPYAGDFGGRDRGNLLSHGQGTTTAYALEKAQVRGALFIGPGEDVYPDQIIGVSSSSMDVSLNVNKAKALTNHRAAGKEDTTALHPPKVLTLEEAVEYVQEGEFVEITPDAIRVGKTPSSSASGSAGGPKKR